MIEFFPRTFADVLHEDAAHVIVCLSLRKREPPESDSRVRRRVE